MNCRNAGPLAGRLPVNHHWFQGLWARSRHTEAGCFLFCIWAFHVKCFSRGSSVVKSAVSWASARGHDVYQKSWFTHSSIMTGLNLKVLSPGPWVERFSCAKRSTENMGLICVCQKRFLSNLHLSRMEIQVTAVAVQPPTDPETRSLPLAYAPCVTQGSSPAYSQSNQQARLFTFEFWPFGEQRKHRQQE